MTNQDVWYTVNSFLKDKNLELDLNQFNRVYALANEQLKRECYGPINDPTGYETESQITDELLPFKSAPTDIALTSGVGTMPSDYWHKVEMIVKSTGKRIQIVDSREYSYRKNNAVTGPSADYPICELLDGTFRVLPTTITEVTLTYLKTGNIPQIVLKQDSTKGIQVYDSANSVAPEWNQDKYIDLIRIFVGLLSLPMDNAQILGYMESKVKSEN